MSPLDTSGLAPTSLAQIDEQWFNVQRFDKKFVVGITTVKAFIDDHKDVLTVLDIEGLRTFHYVTEYFDTPELAFYRDHYMRRKRRLKVRIRHYTDSHRSQCEVKARDGKALTTKFVLPNTEKFEGPAQEFVSDTADMLNMSDRFVGSPSNLIHSATTTFDRVTINRTDCAEKITIDMNFQITAGSHTMSSFPHVALVEVKSTTRRTRTQSDFALLDVFPTSFSKYASALDILVSARPRVNSRRVLQRVFGPTSSQLKS